MLLAGYFIARAERKKKMLFEKISLIDEQFHLLKDQYLATQNGKICYIGAEKPQGEFGRCYDGKNKCLLPGFYNTHCHVPMVLLRGYGEGMRLQDWLFNRIFPFEAKLTAEDVYWGSMLGIAEMLRCGTVSFTDMYFFCEEIIRAAEESGIKAVISRGISSIDDSRPFREMEQCRSVRELVGYRGSGRVRGEAAIHAEYTSSEQFIRGAAELARELGTTMHVHLSETKSEHEECKARHGGRTPAQFFRDCGIFDVKTNAAHCVWVEDADIEILAEKGVSVAHCPSSNAKLASGIAPLGKLLAGGVNVSIGTDGASSNNNLNILEEMTLASLLQKVSRGDPTVMKPQEVLHMATVCGAKAQNRAQAGSLRVGNAADLVVFDLDQPHLTPCHDLLSNILHAATAEDICMTMVDGEVLCEKGICLTIDVERAEYEVKKRAEKIRNLCE